MKRRRIAFSADELAFIEALCELPRGILREEFVEVFQRTDVSVDHIKALCTRRGWITRTPWNDADDAIIRAHFPHVPTARVAAMIGCAVSSVNNRAYKLGLLKSAEYLASPEAGRLRRGGNRGMGSRFVKGQVAHNKGIKRPGWSAGRMRETQFTPGQSGWNWKPVGSVRVSDGYEYTKVSDERGVPTGCNWKMTHVLRWESANGPVVDGHVLKCLDGNRMNTEPTNWQIVPRAILPRLNGGRHKHLRFDEAPAELKPTLLAVAHLEHVARTRKRERAA